MPVGGTNPPHGYHGRRNGLHTPGRSSLPPRVRIEAVSVRHRALNSGVHQDVRQDVHQDVRQSVMSLKVSLKMSLKVSLKAFFYARTRT